MRNLIVGAGGLLGSAFVREFFKRGEYIATTGFGDEVDHYFELNYPESIYEIMEKEQPQRVFMCAYNAHVDASEYDDTVFQTNVSGNVHVALAARRMGAKVYFPSSSYVFNGKSAWPYSEGEKPTPINEYGKHKLLLETLISDICPDAVIFRTVGLFGPEESRKNFVYQVLDRLKNGLRFEAPANQVMNPILSDNLVTAVLDLPESFAGIIHIAGDTCVSKYQWAKEIEKKLHIVGYVGELGDSYQEFDPAPRPANGALDCSKFVELTGHQPKWGLEDFLNGLHISCKASN